MIYKGRHFAVFEMLHIKKYFVIIVLLVGSLPVVAAELITNGDFEQDLSIGWEQDKELIYSQSEWEINSDDYDGDGDKEAYTYIYLDKYATLYQTVSMQSTDILFSASAKLYTPERSSKTVYAAASIIIYYLDASGSTLGETRICKATNNCPWVSTSTLHLIWAPDTEWHDYSFHIQDELVNLSGVNPSNIARLKVALYSYINHYC